MNDDLIMQQSQFLQIEHEERMYLFSLEKKLMLIKYLKPNFGIDGNMYYYSYGEDLQSGIVGFGETPSIAMNDFCNNYFNNRGKK